MTARTANSLLLMLMLALVAPGCGSSKTAAGAAPDSNTSTPASTTSRALVGVFRLTAGSCAGGKVSGSYLRMVYPGGGISTGKFFDNPDSRCSDKGYTIVQGGTDGGLATGRYQPQPSPPFDKSGDALAAAIIRPQTFSAIAFSVSSNPTDPQTGRSVPKPSITLNNGRLSGDVRAIDAAWNNQQFNQGSPKPDGSRPGLTTPLRGTYDPATKRFVIEWASQIVGGPFNDFTGSWHLEGTFVPSTSSNP